MRPGSRGLVLLALTGVCAGCAEWAAQGFEPRVVVEREHPDRLRLVRTDSSRIELQQPRVMGDSLAGVAASRPVAVPLDSVAYVELRRGNPALPYAAAGLGVAAGILVLLAATMN